MVVVAVVIAANALAATAAPQESLEKNTVLVALDDPAFEEHLHLTNKQIQNTQTTQTHNTQEQQNTNNTQTNKTHNKTNITKNTHGSMETFEKHICLTNIGGKQAPAATHQRVLKS